MEYVKGVNLENMLARNGRMSAPRVGRIIGELCEVLQAAHDAATNSNCASAAERATFIRAGSCRRAPRIGTVDWINARANASTSA